MDQSDNTNSKAVAIRRAAHVMSYDEIERIGRAFVASGMFGRDMDKVSKAITKIMAGQELGFAPFASMRAIHVIEGNATLSANTMAAMVKSSNRYDYDVLEKTDKVCRIAFYGMRKGKRVKLGIETFDWDEATKAKLTHKNNWQNYPKAMLFARCMSNGVRSFAPDVFNGVAVYTPDELDGDERMVVDIIEPENQIANPAVKHLPSNVDEQGKDINQDKATDLVLEEGEEGDDNPSEEPEQGVEDSGAEDSQATADVRADEDGVSAGRPEHTADEAEPEEDSASSPRASKKQVGFIKGKLMARGVPKEKRALVAGYILSLGEDREIEDLSSTEASALLSDLEELTKEQMQDVIKAAESTQLDLEEGNGED